MNETLYGPKTDNKAHRIPFAQGAQDHKAAILQLMAFVMLKLGERNITITQADVDRLLYENLTIEEHRDGSFSLQIHSKD